VTATDPPRRGLRITRRRALVVSAAAISVALSGHYVRYGVGDEFEDHVASVLGVSRNAARSLLESARRRLGAGDYDIRAAAFLAVTTFPGVDVVPEGSRRQAVESLLIPMIGTSEENLVALGLRGQVSGVCRGLLAP
jgi:hypothetical protein